MKTSPSPAYRRSSLVSCIEPLEARIAPATIASLQIINATTATYTDVDGDRVTVKVSVGDLHNATFTGIAGLHGDQLQTLDLSGGGFDKANLTFSVSKVGGGDGLANIGYINSTGHDLGKVMVKGDLGRINAGSASATIPAVKSLTVYSMGRLGTDSQSAGGDLTSSIFGALGSLKVTRDVKTASIEVLGGRFGSITIGGSLIGGGTGTEGELYCDGDMGPVKIAGDVLGGDTSFSGYIQTRGELTSVTIGGSIIGGSGSLSGAIYSKFDIGPVKIGHNLQGGSGGNSGWIDCGGNLASLTIGGSVIGGLGNHSGAVYADDDLGPVKIGHDMLGGAGLSSGNIESDASLASFTIGGSLIGGASGASGEIYCNDNLGLVKIGHDIKGGADFNSGHIFCRNTFAGLTLGGSLIGGSGRRAGAIECQGDIGPVKIGHDLIGASIAGTASLEKSGVIESAGRIASVTIGGSIITGSDSSTGSLTWNATIRAAEEIGSLTVKGSLIGHGDTGTGASPVVISALGQAAPGATTDLAIGKITIGGRVEFANFLAGYKTDLSAFNGDAQIGPVKVGGDWAASNLIAGAMNTASGNTIFGDANDASIGAGSTGIIAKIASITIVGQVFGTPASVSSADHFGFVAQQIGTVKIGGSTIARAANPQPVGSTDDMTVHIV